VPPPAVAPQPITRALALPRLRVLVVDDNVDSADLLATLLRHHRHEVIVVNSGQDALHLAEGFRPQVILLDIGMPDMSGLEVARRLRARSREPRPLLVAITGWNKADDVERTKDAGFDVHLVKPVSESQLLDALRAFQA
jgi:CheY-like chemotaxis protein